MERPVLPWRSRADYGIVQRIAQLCNPGDWTSMPRLLARLVLTTAILAAAHVPGRAQSDTLTLISGFGPGGGDSQGGSARQSGASQLRPQPVYDLTARLYARHIGRFLPGIGKVSLRLMPGAGSLRAARWLYRDAPADGSVLATVSGRALRQMMLRGEMQGDQPFTAIGGRITGEYICAHRRRSGQVAAPMAFGATAPGERSFVHAQAIAEANIAGIRLVAGYANSVQLALAFRRREIDGFCGLGAAMIRSQLGSAMASGELVPLVRFSPPGRGVLQHIAGASDKLANPASGTGNASQMRDGIRFLERQGMIDFALLAPLGVPGTQSARLRDAYSQMLADPEFRREAVRWSLEVNPVTAAEIDRAFGHLNALAKTAQPAMQRWSGTR
jgi:hypothetical protein